MARSEGNWCLIESDPGVFTEIIKGFGVRGLECEEIHDVDCMGVTGNVHGLIFLYKWSPDTTSVSNIETSPDRLKDIFFAQQVITNACATQALLNILFNLNGDIKLGETLEELKEFCGSFDSHMKGLTISNSDQIRKVHNSFSCEALYEMEDKQSPSSEDTYHFIGYMPIKGRLYELDGLQEGPIDHGEIDDGHSWIEVVKPVLVDRMKKHHGTHFNIIAVVPDKMEELQKQLKEVESNGDPNGIMGQILSNIQEEVAKLERYRVENIRRRHNYMPFIIELMKLLAEEGKLSSLVEKAEEMALNRRKRRMEARESRNKMDTT